MIIAPPRMTPTIALAAFCALVAAALPTGRAGAAMLDEAGERAVLEADQLFGDMAERMAVLGASAPKAAAEHAATRDDTAPEGATEDADGGQEE